MRAAEATTVAAPHAALNGGGRSGTPAVSELVDALQDGVVLADRDGVIAVASRQLEEMFGYRHGELRGYSVDSLVPTGLRAAHRSHRAGFARAPTARPMGGGARLVGLRKDGTTFAAQISLSPVTGVGGCFTLAVIRDVTETQRLDDFTDLATATIAAGREDNGSELLDTVITGLFRVGLSLQAAADLLPAEAARQRITEALTGLDVTIRRIRDVAFGASGR
jgi:PAS domain S-box-containing protein